MKVYNQGGRLFTHFELNLQPGSFTEIPEKHVPAIEKLLKDYPTELVTDENARSSSQKASQQITQLKEEVAALKAQNQKLQNALLATPPAAAAVPAPAPVVPPTPRKQKI